GLRRPDILVIPVLVNNAQMPGVDNLPLDLTDLAFRNAAVVRNNPDFNRDSIWLIDQIRHDFDIVPATKSRRMPWGGLLVAAALLLMLALAVLLVPGLLRSNPAADATPSAAAVSPVNAGEYMVLVAQPERLGGQERDVQRFIADDLRRNLEDTAEFSPIRIRTYPAVIRSDEAARQAAEASGAAVIVWGNYDDSRVELDVQIGALSLFPYNTFPREELEKIANVRVRLTNERQQSAAMPVLAVLQALYTADGDPMSVARNSALGRLLTVNDGTLQAGGIAANWTQMIQFFLRNQNSDALAAIDQALVLDPSSAIGYIARALLLQKAGNFDLALDDVYTAQRLGPSGWGSPIFMLGNDALFFQGNSAEARPHYDAFITARPNDPNGYTMRGISDYLSGQYQDAGKDFDRSIELSSIYNFPYFFNVALALRDGRLPVAQELMSTILRLFPDPTAAEVLLQASYGASTPDTKLIPLARAFGHLALGQWRTVVTDVTTAEQTGNILPELYFIEGFAYCNLRDYHTAEAAYTAALNLDPDFTLVYGMRAEVRLHQNNLIGAAADTGVVLSSSQAAELAPFVPLIQSGKLTCENFFTFDFTVLETATPAASLDGSAVPATRATERPSSTPTLTATATSTPTVTPSPTQTSAPVVSATPTPLYQVEPVAANEWMVLVAELEPLAGKADTNITRFIARDLSRRLEEDVPFSRVRVRRTDQVIHSDREARQAGEETGAAVVVWGNYTGDLIELEVHVGSLRSFNFIAIDRPTLERTVNVTMHLTDPRRQSVATQVLGVLAMLQSADGNAYEVLRTLAINGQLEESRPAHAEIVSSGVSAAVQSYLWRSLTDSAAALDDISRAIDLDPGNALLYISRGSTYLRLRRLDSARRDADSATRRGPDGWTMPLYIRASAAMLESDLDTAINIYSQIIAQRPELWFPLNMRAALYYLKHDYEVAKTDYAQVFTLQPDTNFPYVVSALIALRDGRMADARHYLNTVLTEFPDPNFSARIAAAAFGDDSGIIFVPMFSAVGHFILEQYDQMLEDTQIALAMDDQITDLYALVGFAYCNLGQYADAEGAYTIALDLEPEKPFVYLLRADVRLKQLNLVGALEDTDRVRQLVADTGIGEELIAYVDAGLRLEVGCTNFFEWTPPE
ncbi:MAG: tetratricopeptide repeat protein, partial [Anaerolineae bacterium]|nr:tetratricopeptide repeat protein [Anaerolineae bacterium]